MKGRLDGLARARVDGARDVLPVVAVVGAPFLLPVGRIVRAVQINYDALGHLSIRIHKQFHKQMLNACRLVLNASVRKETPFVEMSFDEWRSLLGITLDGAFHCTKACLPAMIKAGGGSIVTLGGMTALSGSKGRVHGSVGKHGLYGMTRALARELGEHGIRANCVAPGQMNTARAAGRSLITGWLSPLCHRM